MARMTKTAKKMMNGARNMYAATASRVLNRIWKEPRLETAVPEGDVSILDMMDVFLN